MYILTQRTGGTFRTDGWKEGRLIDGVGGGFGDVTLLCGVARVSRRSRLKEQPTKPTTKHSLRVVRSNKPTAVVVRIV